MILKKKEFFLLIFLILLQSCSGGRIGNFLESSFSDLEKTSQDEVLQNNLVNKKIVEKENKEIKEINVGKNKKDINLEKENKKFDDKKIKKLIIFQKKEKLSFNLTK